MMTYEQILNEYDRAHRLAQHAHLLAWNSKESRKRYAAAARRFRVACRRNGYPNAFGC